MLTVRDLMTVNPDTVMPETPLRHVIAKMNKDGCRQLPVVDGGKLVGIVTDRDVRLAVNSPVLEVDEEHAERRALLNRLTVESCMTADPISVAPDVSAYQVADLLSIHKFGALPVVENERLVGIITVTDFLRYMVCHRPAVTR